MESPTLNVSFVFLCVSSKKLSFGVSAQALTKHGTTTNATMLDSNNEAMDRSEDLSNSFTFITIITITSCNYYSVLSRLSAGRYQFFYGAYWFSVLNVCLTCCVKRIISNTRLSRKRDWLLRNVSRTRKWQFTLFFCQEECLQVKHREGKF